jgi:hypothetical protein
MPKSTQAQRVLFTNMKTIRYLSQFLLCASLWGQAGTTILPKTTLPPKTTVFAGGTGGTGAFVTHDYTPGFGSGVVSMTTTGSTLLIAIVTGATGVTISDAVTSPSCASPCNAWNALTPVTTYDVQIFYAYAKTGGGSLVVGTGHTFTESNTNGDLFGMTFSGTNTTSPLETNGQNGVEDGFVTSGQPGACPSSGSLSQASGEVVVTALQTGSATTNPAINSGFTLVDDGSSTAPADAYLITTLTTAVNPTWSWTTSSHWGSAIACFLHS